MLTLYFWLYSIQLFELIFNNPVVYSILGLALWNKRLNEFLKSTNPQLVSVWIYYIFISRPTAPTFFSLCISFVCVLVKIFFLIGAHGKSYLSGYAGEFKIALYFPLKRRLFYCVKEKGCMWVLGKGFWTFAGLHQCILISYRLDFCGSLFQSPT